MHDVKFQFFGPSLLKKYLTITIVRFIFYIVKLILEGCWTTMNERVTIKQVCNGPRDFFAEKVVCEAVPKVKDA